MKKDLDKLLSRTLLTYFTILFVVFALKLFGLNYFGLDTDNEIINSINDFVIYWRLENVWYCITLFISGFLIMSITCNDNSKKMMTYVFYCLPIFILVQFLKTKYNNVNLFIIIDFVYLLVLSLCYNKFIKRDKIHKYNISNYFLFTLSTILFQFISLITRNVTIINQTNLDKYFIISILLDIDYFVLMFMTYKLYFIKGGKSLWVWVHSSSLDLLISLRNLPKKFLQSYQNSKPKENDDELAYKIYIVLFWLYNFFTVAVILFIATLNHTFIECIFILSSFWINKGVFGKSFHLNKASTCFVVSSLSYYVLNRITWKVGVSFLIPIILGILLSYITSLFMARKENMYLYRGISLDNFNKLINKVTTNPDHIEICKRFYVDKESNVKIAMTFPCSESNVKQVKKRINDKIKELYK